MTRTTMMAAALSLTALMMTDTTINARGDSPSASLLAQPVHRPMKPGQREEPHALRDMSLFAVAPPQPPSFQKHDLIQIVVREESQVRSQHEMDLDKRYRLDGGIPRFPRFTLLELLKMQIPAGRTTDMPELRMNFRNQFDGDGELRRRDNMTGRITAEVIEVMPNGNMVLEARTHIRIDNEEQTMRVTGICRPDDVTDSNTILSSQIHNLVIEKDHEGELRRTTEKGIIAKALDAIFAF